MNPEDITEVLEFWYDNNNLAELKGLLVGHSIVKMGGEEGDYSCAFELDNGTILEFAGTEMYGADDWDVEEIYTGTLPTPPIEDVETVDEIAFITRRVMAGRAAFKATLGGKEVTLVSFNGAGDGEWGTGYTGRVYEQTDAAGNEGGKQ